jgi:nitrite reductase (NADH) small subunit
MSTNRHIIAQVDELPPGNRKVVEIAGRSIGIFNVRGEFFALRNLCPHRSGPLCLGRVRPLVVCSELYQVDHERDGEILKCPWHQWEFDLRTGEALFDPQLRVKTYRVVQEGNQIVLYT